ncbi:MAG: archease [candidate division NC10 bacterium]|nr:archease [candidate division NC10 bacterium]
MGDPDQGFEFFEMTADEGLRAWGKTMGEAFIHAARGMFSLIVDPKDLRPVKSHRVQVEAKDREALLVAWLSELLYLYEVEGFLPVEYAMVELNEQRLEAELRGDLLDPGRHSLKGLVKAATYHRLEVKEADGKWQVQVVLDV